MKISTERLQTLKRTLKKVFSELNDRDVTTYGNGLRVYSDAILKAIDWEIDSNKEETNVTA